MMKRKRSAHVHQKESTEDRLKFLENAINEIYEYDASSYSYNKKLYMDADYLVLHNSGKKLYTKIVSTVTSHIKQMAASIEVSQGSLFLEELNKKWMEHEKAYDTLRWISLSMDRTCIPSTHKTSVQMLGIKLWMDNIINYDTIKRLMICTLLFLICTLHSVLQSVVHLLNAALSVCTWSVRIKKKSVPINSPIKMKLKAALLETVQRDREGGVVNRDMMRNTLIMLVKLGVLSTKKSLRSLFLIHRPASTEGNLSS